MFEIVGSYVYDGATDTLSGSGALGDLPAADPWIGATCPTNWGMMRQGFDVDTIKRMRFMRWLIQHGKVEG